jgi:hypothetical protein
MLTHTIRALTLIGLITVAHAAKPFTLDNLASFAVTTAVSIAQVLPEKTLGRLEKAGMLAALVTGNWNNSLSNEKLLSSRFTDQFNAVQAPVSLEKAPRQARRQPAHPVKSGNRMSLAGKPVLLAARREFQPSRNFRRWASAPVPSIPGLKLSLISNATLVALPQLPMVRGTLDSPANDGAGFNLLFNEAACEQTASPKEIEWVTEEISFRPTATAFRVQTAKTQIFKVHVISPRLVNGQACSQPVKGAPRAAGSGRQSC